MGLRIKGKKPGRVIIVFLMMVMIMIIIIIIIMITTMIKNHHKTSQSNGLYGITRQFFSGTMLEKSLNGIPDPLSDLP